MYACRCTFLMGESPESACRGKDIAEGKGAHREEGSEGSRLWDSKTGEKLDKDRFRRDLGGVEDAYREIMDRLEKKLEGD